MEPDLYEEIVRLRREGRPAALATIVNRRGSTPGRLAQKMVIRDDGTIVGTIGGGCVEADVIRCARNVLDTGLPRKIEFVLAGEEAERTGLACGGRLEIMVELLNDPELFVIGCGHVGLRIAGLAKAAGFKVTALDDRPDYADHAKLPHVDAVVCAGLDTLDEALRVGANGYVVSVTRGHDHDYEVLRWALTTPARYIGVVGSRSKRTQFFRALRDEGVGDEDLARVRLPVGLDIGADTPDEIAIAVVAELVALRRRGRIPGETGPSSTSGA